MQNIVKARYTKMTPIQQYAMPLIAEGRDIMGCAPTGCGKTVNCHFGLSFCLMQFYRKCAHF
jgi:superfamily II DNA/RNA helicase